MDLYDKRNITIKVILPKRSSVVEMPLNNADYFHLPQGKLQAN